MRILFFASIVVCIFPTLAGAQPQTAALYSDAATGINPEMAAALEADLTATGYTVTPIDGVSLSNAQILDIANFSLLVLPDTKRLPMRSIEPVNRFLQQGGNLLALNTPAWRERLVFVNNEWQTPEAFRIKSVLDARPMLSLISGQNPLRIGIEVRFVWTRPHSTQLFRMGLHRALPHWT